VLLAEEFYDENMAGIEIPLSVTDSPQQNAAKFYKDYGRMKNAEKELTAQLEKALRKQGTCKAFWRSWNGQIRMPSWRRSVRNYRTGAICDRTAVKSG